MLALERGEHARHQSQCHRGHAGHGDVTAAVFAQITQILELAIEIGKQALDDAPAYLEGLLEPLCSQDPEHYNDDARLGYAINKAVFVADAVRGWGRGLKVRG